jgi:glycosyltransferase involved in cell wall biosynthesis
MGDTDDTTRSEPQLDVVICVDDEVLTRLRPVIRHLCVGLVESSVRIRIVTSSAESYPLTSLGPIEVIPHPPLVWPMRRRRMTQIVKKLSHRPPTVIYALGQASFDIARNLADVFDTELVVQVTTTRDVDELIGLKDSRCTHVIAASDPLIKRVQRTKLFSDDQLSLIRPGVLRGNELTCFKDPAATPTMVCTARLDESNAIDVVIKATAIIRDHGLDLLTFLLGEGQMEDKLRSMSRSLSQSPNLTFARPSGDLTEVLRGADMFVLGPGEEHISARALQALASGTAVLCFDGGVGDFFRDGETAIVCKERSADTLAHAIERLLANHTLAHEIADRARAYVKQHHQMSRMAELTVDVFRTVSIARRTFKIRS